MLYVFIAKSDDYCLDVIDETVSFWNQHWQFANYHFEDEFDKDKVLFKFKGTMFYVFER